MLYIINVVFLIIYYILDFLLQYSKKFILEI